MHQETLRLLKDLKLQLAVSLAWPASESIRSRLNVAIMRGEDSVVSNEDRAATAEFFKGQFKIEKSDTK